MPELDERKAILKNQIEDVKRLYNLLVKMEATGVDEAILPPNLLQQGELDNEEKILRALLVQIREGLSKVKYAQAGLILAAPKEAWDSLLESMKGILGRIVSVEERLHQTLMVLPGNLINRRAISTIVRLTGLSELMAELDFLGSNL